MASLFIGSKFSATDADGAPLAGGKVYTYAAGTLTGLDTFTDQTGSSPNQNPVILDAAGRASIWLDPSLTYRFIVKDENNVIAPDGDVDNIRAPDYLAGTLADPTLSTTGAAMVGFKGSLNYVGLTIGARLLDVGASPRSLGATGDGVADDTAFITVALLYSKTLDLSNHSWKITSTIDLPAGCIVNMRGAAIVGATGATPIFRFNAAKEGLLIQGGGSASASGQVTGTASAFLFCEGNTDAPTLASQYARQIRVYDVHVTSTTITNFLDFNKAVRQVYVRGCMVFTPNGINASGKCVEVMLSDSIIFSATGAAGTYGIKLRSTGGTSNYNEGWSVTNCTIDNFEIAHDVTDVFVYQITGGYHGVNATLSASSGYAFQFQAPSSSLCEELTIGGGAVVAGRIRFVGSAGGQAYNSTIDALFQGVPGTAVAIENNAANITIRGKWKAGSGTAIGVVGTNNNASIVVSGDFDSTYTNGVVLGGANGANCVVGPLSGPTTGDIYGAGRSNIQLRGLPIHSVGVAAYKQVSSAANLGAGATYAVGAAISTQALGFARGETGVIIINLSYSGANAATQNVQIGTPAGMALMAGTGYAANNLYLGAATGLLAISVPYYCTADGSGNVTVTNQAGNTLTINNQGYCAVRKDM